MPATLRENGVMPYALVTGASLGIGRELARECARDGYDLILTSRSRRQLEATAEELKATTSQDIRILPCDLSVPNAGKQLFDDVQRLGLPVEMLINNAGFGLLGRFWEVDYARQMQMVQLNVSALTELSRLFLPRMTGAGRGYILNVASTAAFQPGPLMAVYYASKSYVLSFSVALANEAKEFGVAVSCLCPGPTRSEFAERAGMTKTKLFKGSSGMSAAKVAHLGYQALKARKAICVTGRANALMAFLTRFAPMQLTAAMARRVQQI